MLARPFPLHAHSSPVSALKPAHFPFAARGLPSGANGRRLQYIFKELNHAHYCTNWPLQGPCFFPLFLCVSFSDTCTTLPFFVFAFYSLSLTLSLFSAIYLGKQKMWYKRIKRWKITRGNFSHPVYRAYKQNIEYMYYCYCHHLYICIPYNTAAMTFLLYFFPFIVVIFVLSRSSDVNANTMQILNTKGLSNTFFSLSLTL